MYNKRATNKSETPGNPPRYALSSPDSRRASLHKFKSKTEGSDTTISTR